MSYHVTMLNYVMESNEGRTWMGMGKGEGEGDVIGWGWG